MSNIVERLRADGDRDEGRPYSTMHEAADEIERLRAENMEMKGFMGDRLNNDIEAAALRAEIEGLKAALRDLLHAIGHDRKELIDDAADRARAALEGLS